MSNKIQTCEKLSVVGEKCRDLHAWEEEEDLRKTDGKIRCSTGRCRKPVTLVLVESVNTADDEQSQTLEFGAVALLQFLERQAILTAPFEKFSEIIMLYFPYTNRQTQKLLDRDKPQRLSSDVNFLNIMTVDLSQPWNDDVELHTHTRHISIPMGQSRHRIAASKQRGTADLH
ncbi:hypothetical protein TNCV_3656661 [Trichonephila clavipes]|nr:hypothetical protein TNCV_3656661 [Trichonephila clavipes]